MSKIKSKGVMGRPPKPYDKQVATALCAVISTTTKGLKKILKMDKRFPTTRIVYRWLADNEDFRNRYKAAKETQAQILADQIIEIADTTKRGIQVTKDFKGRKKKRYVDMIEHRRLQIDARKWILTKLLPHKYGDKVQVEATGDPLTDLAKAMDARSKTLGRPEGMITKITKKTNLVKAVSKE